MKLNASFVCLEHINRMSIEYNRPTLKDSINLKLTTAFFNLNSIDHLRLPKKNIMKTQTKNKEFCFLLSK